MREPDISELCRHCPFDDCSGCYRKDCKVACETMKRWREDELTDREAEIHKWKQYDRREEDEWLFTVFKSSLIKNLKNSSVPQKLRMEFRKNGHPLEEDAELLKYFERTWWIFEDGKKRYRLEEYRKSIDVYKVESNIDENQLTLKNISTRT